MIKVLHLRSSGSFLGAERVVIELSKRLPTLGYEPVVGVPLEIGDDIPELYTHAKEHGIRAQLFYGKSPYDLSVIGQVREFVKENHIDIVHSHGYREDLYAIGSRKHAAIMATNHLWKRTDWKLKIYAFLDGYLLRRFLAVVAVSKPIVKELIEAKIKPENIFVIANGIETEQYSNSSEDSTIRKELNIGKNKTLLVTVSSLSEEKGINFALTALADALKTNKHLHLLVVGTGEESEKLAQQTQSLDITKNVSFVGRRNDISRVLKNSDVFLLPSLNEGLPMAMLEAMAAGKAIIATDVGDVASALANDAGIIIESRDVKALTEKILLLSQTPRLIREYGDRAQRQAIERYSAQNMATEYVNIYKQILDLN